MIVSVLALHGLRPIAVEPFGRQRKYHFESTAYLREVVESFTRGTLTVNARMLSLVYKDNVTQLRRQTATSAVESRQ
jgi:hypothetical protein